MSELLHNMSVPPRSEVKFNQLQLKKYICFNPSKLSSLLFDKGYSNEQISINTENYALAHSQITSIIERPTGYMIGEVIEANDTKRSKERLMEYNFVECTNLELLIVVFCSTVGDLYIPNRTLSYEKNKFDKILLFPEDEVNS